MQVPWPYRCVVQANVVFALVPLEVIHLLGNFIPNPENLISIDCECCLLIVLFAMPTAVALLQWTGFFGCG
jgi:hypothetical protein